MFPTNNVITDQKMYSYDFAQFLGTKFSNLNKNRQEFKSASQYNPLLCNHHDTDKALHKPHISISLLAFIYDNESASMKLYIAGEFDAKSTELLYDAYMEWLDNLPPSLIINCNWQYNMVASRHCTKAWLVHIGWENTVVLQDDLMYILYKNLDEEVFGYSASAICHQSVLSALATNCAEPEDAYELLANQTSFIEHQTALYCCENASYISKQPISNITNLFNNNYAQALRYVAMYDERKAEWRFGRWGSKHIGIQDNWPEAYTINYPNYLLSSAVDFADCPASKQKQALIAKEGKGSIKYQLRSNLPHILECAELAHDELLINGLYEELMDMEDDYLYSHAAVRSLCDWWNQNAPVEMRCAASFRIYIYDYYDNHLISFVREAEPLIPAERIMDCKSLALFGDNIVVVFLKDPDSYEGNKCYDVAGDIFPFAGYISPSEAFHTFECLDTLHELYLDSNNDEGACNE